MESASRYLVLSPSHGCPVQCQRRLLVTLLVVFADGTLTVDAIPLIIGIIQAVLLRAVRVFDCDLIGRRGMNIGPRQGE